MSPLFLPHALRVRLISAPTTLSPGSLKHVIFGVTLAILISPNSVLVLCFGLAGIPGNSVFTGTLLTVATLLVGVLCFRRDIVLQPADYLFFALLLCMATSFVLNGWTSNAREYELLILSLAAYPACRFISRMDIVSGRTSFMWAIGIIVLLGTIVTAVALLQQWNGEHGRPIVFGFDAAATYFLGSLCFLVIALVTGHRLTARRAALISSLIFLPTAIFAASMVRFTFIALAGSLGLAMIVSEAKQRKYVIAVAVVILVAIVTGLVARSNKAGLYADYAMEQTLGDVGVEKLPTCYLKVNLKNSIAIRKALVQDALFLIPNAGWIGAGLDSFMKFSCIKLTEVHNSILQAMVEFGWLGGSLLLIIIILVVSLMYPLAKNDGATRFVLVSLVFVEILSLAHGRISRDAIIFAFLGCAVGLKETVRTPVPTTSAVAV